MPNTEMIITASGRTKEEITASIRIRMRSMVSNALEIGMDLIEMKEACRHGEWMPWLKEIGFSASTAANYMRIAREVGADSRMAQLPYTKILALMAAPKEEREELAEAAESLSAVEIRRLTEERNKAAEAANAETARADQAERDAKQFYSENASLRTELMNTNARMEREINSAYNKGLRQGAKNAYEDLDVKQMSQDLKEKQEQIRGLTEELERKQADLLQAENNRVEVVPADYEKLKRQQQELIDAAAEAEERANAAEAALEEARAEAAQNGVSDFEKMHFAMKSFMMQCELMACRPEGLMRDAQRALRDVERIRHWCDAMENALTVHVAEGAVV